MSRPIGKTIARMYQNRIPFDGMRIWTGEGSLNPLTKAALFWELYEKSERRMIARYLPQDRHGNVCVFRGYSTTSNQSPRPRERGMKH